MTGIIWDLSALEFLAVIASGMIAGLSGWYLMVWLPRQNEAGKPPPPADPESGNVFFALFAAVAMVGVVGAGVNTMVRGPVTSMSQVTKRSVAENNMIASTRLAIISASTQQAQDGDCDNDGMIEPLPYRDAGTNPKPAGGGYLPTTIGAALQDPWGTEYGYCVWDHGSSIKVAGCGGAGARRLAGTNPGNDHYAIAVISAGPDRIFQTVCNAAPTTPLINKPGGSDDAYLGYTYAEAIALGNGLWQIKQNEPEVAVIDKNLEITNDGGAKVFGFDSNNATPSLEVDYIRLLNNPATRGVSLLSNLTLEGTNRLGIGNVNPIYPLDVTGDVRINPTGATSARLEIGTGATADKSAYIDLTGDTATYTDYGLRLIRGGGTNANSELRHRGTGTLHLVAQEAGQIRLRTTNADRMTIAAAGNVGIGTNNPQSMLHVASGAKIGQIQIGANAADAQVDMAYPYESISPTQSTNNLRLQAGYHIYFHTGMTGTEPDDSSKVRMSILSNGNIGVGTTAPGYKLHVDGDTYTNGWLRTGGNTGWLSQTHGGGWHMSDANYIRAYGSKAVEIPNTGSLIGLQATSTSTHAIRGNSTSGTGVYGVSSTTHGIRGTSTSAAGVYGDSTNGHGVYGSSSGNYGVVGESTSSHGILGRTHSTGSGGVFGYAQNLSIYGILGYANAYAFYGSGNVHATGDIRGAGGIGTALYHGNFNSAASRVNLLPNGFIWSTTGPAETSSNLYLHRHTTVGHLATFGYGTSTVGSITTTGASTSYNTTSDYRLKENVASLEDALRRMMLLKPIRFSFKADKNHEMVDGFLAHEVQEIVPYAVKGEKDELDKDGEIKPQQLDHSKLVPLLTSSVQKLKLMFDDLAEKVTDLTGIVMRLAQDVREHDRQIDELNERINRLNEIVEKVIKVKPSLPDVNDVDDDPIEN